MSMHEHDASRNGRTQVAWHAIAVLLLTSLHHAYGAYVYDTPWRNHVVLVAGVTAAVIIGSLAATRSRPSGLPGALARWTFALTTIAIPVLLIGVFEGLYNHVVKDVLYFSGASGALMSRLFPAPRYELPNDAIFEITGVLQVVPAATTAWHLFRMLRVRRLRRPASAPLVAGD